MLINIIYYFTELAVSDLIYMIFVTDIITSYTIKYSIPLAIMGYLGYASLSIIKIDSIFSLIELTSFITRGISFLAFIFALAFLKGVINKNVTMKQLIKEIETKNKEIESLVLIKERNRIASEMHDTVGHTLTTSIVELEAAKLLFKTQPEESYKKLTLGCDQLRKSLNEIRSVVKKIDSGSHIIEFIPSIQEMAYEVEKHTSIQVVVDMEAIKLLKIQENILYSAVQEGITNALKHGDATEILITGVRQLETYQVKIIDNGRGIDLVSKGFGLNKMSERIKGIGGIVSFHSGDSNGFRISIDLPIQNESEGNIDEQD